MSAALSLCLTILFHDLAPVFLTSLCSIRVTIFFAMTTLKTKGSRRRRIACQVDAGGLLASLFSRAGPGWAEFWVVDLGSLQVPVLAATGGTSKNQHVTTFSNSVPNGSPIGIVKGFARSLFFYLLVCLLIGINIQ